MGDALSEEILLSLAQTFYPLTDAEPQHKRALTSEDSGSTSDEAAHKPKKRKKTKGRTPSHVAKREEKNHLLKELAFLEARAAALRQEAGIPDPKDVAATEQQVDENKQLKDMIQVQQNAMAVAQSAFAEFSTLRGHNPLKTYIRLSNDTATRRSEVCALKHGHLERAKQFLQQRMQLVANPNRPFHEESGYLTDEGDYIATKLDVHQFVGVQSVRQVFDALEFYFMNLEITTTELGSDLTVREDSNDLDSNGNGNHPMLHHRLVTMLSNGPIVEKNAIKFFQYFEADTENENGPYGIMAASPVDEDELYPYSPAERLRKDISAAMKLSSFTRKKLPGSGEHELVVVLTRWFRVQLHRSELKFPPHVLQEVQRSVACFTDPMVRSMNQSLYGAP